MGCHALLQGTFLTQAWNPHPLHLLKWQVGFFTNSATWEAECLAVRLLPNHTPPTKKKKKRSSEPCYLQNRRKTKKNYNAKVEKSMSQTLFKETKYLISKFLVAIAEIFSEVQFNEFMALVVLHKTSRVSFYSGRGKIYQTTAVRSACENSHMSMCI